MANQPAVIDDPATRSVTVEADTIEDALARISAELGPDARILGAERVRRGGIGGFFARELVEVHVEAGERHASGAAAAAPGQGVTAAFDQLLAAAESTHSASGARADHNRVEHTTPAVVTVDWSPSQLSEVGLPDTLARAIAGLDPADELAHLGALAAVLAPVCGPLPSGPAHLFGERAERLRAAVDLTESPGGYLHLVVGDELPSSLPGVPAVVSWVSDRGAARAISLALGSGALLGYGVGSAFGAPARRVSAVEAALAIRELMERR